MNDEERTRILRMVAEGQIGPEEAAGLLEALESRPEPEPAPRPVNGVQAPNPPHAYGPPDAPERPRRRPRAVVIQVREGGENKVNLRIPIGLALSAGKFIPRVAQKHLANYEIDLSDFLEHAGETESGTLLEVKDGENKVLIIVE